MVHSEVYLNKYVVGIAQFSTSACPDCSQNVQKTALFCTFSFFNFSSIFPGGQLTPFAPMCGRPRICARDCRHSQAVCLESVVWHRLLRSLWRLRDFLYLFLIETGGVVRGAGTMKRSSPVSSGLSAPSFDGSICCYTTS